MRRKKLHQKLIWDIRKMNCILKRDVCYKCLVFIMANKSLIVILRVKQHLWCWNGPEKYFVGHMPPHVSPYMSLKFGFFFSLARTVMIRSCRLRRAYNMFS